MCACVFFLGGGGIGVSTPTSRQQWRTTPGKSLFNRYAQRHLAGNPDVMAVDAEDFLNAWEDFGRFSITAHSPDLVA